MRLFSKVKKHFFVFQNQQQVLMIWLLLVILFLMLALSVYASFIFAKIEQVSQQVTGLEIQTLRLANDQAQVNQKMDGVQTMLLRLQSQAYRSNLPEEE